MIYGIGARMRASSNTHTFSNAISYDQFYQDRLGTETLLIGQSGKGRWFSCSFLSFPFFFLREIDKQVARTKSRPLARGAVTTQQAVGWLGVQLGVSAGVLFSLEPAAVVLGAASLGLVGICPCRAIRPLDSSLPPVPYSTMRLLLIYQPK